MSEDIPIFDKCQNGRRFTNEMRLDKEHRENQINKDMTEADRQSLIEEFLTKKKEVEAND